MENLKLSVRFGSQEVVLSKLHNDFDELRAELGEKFGLPNFLCWYRSPTDVTRKLRSITSSDDLYTVYSDFSEDVHTVHLLITSAVGLPSSAQQPEAERKTTVRPRTTRRPLTKAKS
jgi:hypothetical protein